MKKLKIKDVVMIALLSALYLVIYMIAGTASMVFGAFGHAISSGVCGFFAGAIFLFLSRKVGKFGQYTIMQAICMIIFAIMGAGYLPWLVTSMVAAVIADLLASKNNRVPVLKVACASGIFHAGQALGAIIPSWFFVESYKSEWIARGQTPEAMEEMVQYTGGFMGFVATVVVFALSFAGVYLGYAILRKHLEKKEALAA